MSILEHIGALTPANKTAGLVTGRPSPDVREDDRSEKHRNLAAIAQKLQVLIATSPPGSAVRRRYAAQYKRVNDACAVLNKRRDHDRAHDLPSLFLDSAREMLPKALFTTIMGDARRKLDGQEAADKADAA